MSSNTMYKPAIYHIVYQTTNLVNGKVYIGKHSTRNLNDYYKGSGNALKRAIKKYGSNNFKVEHLFYAFTAKYAYDVETEIVTREFVNRTDTYNMKQGGSGSEIGRNVVTVKCPRSIEHCLKLSAAHKGIRHTESTKNQMSIDRTGRFHSPETIEKIRLSQKALNKTNSPETRAKLSKALIGRVDTCASKLKKSKSRSGKILVNDGTKCFMIPYCTIMPVGLSKGKLPKL